MWLVYTRNREREREREIEREREKTHVCLHGVDLGRIISNYDCSQLSEGPHACLCLLARITFRVDYTNVSRQLINFSFRPFYQGFHLPDLFTRQLKAVKNHGYEITCYLSFIHRNLGLYVRTTRA